MGCGASKTLSTITPEMTLPSAIQDRDYPIFRDGDAVGGCASVAFGVSARWRQLEPLDRIALQLQENGTDPDVVEFGFDDVCLWLLDPSLHKQVRELRFPEYAAAALRSQELREEELVLRAVVKAVRKMSENITTAAMLVEEGVRDLIEGPIVSTYGTNETFAYELFHAIQQIRTAIRQHTLDEIRIHESNGDLLSLMEALLDSLTELKVARQAIRAIAKIFAGEALPREREEEEDGSGELEAASGVMEERVGEASWTEVLKLRDPPVLKKSEVESQLQEAQDVGFWAEASTWREQYLREKGFRDEVKRLEEVALEERRKEEEAWLARLNEDSGSDQSSEKKLRLPRVTRGASRLSMRSRGYSVRSRVTDTAPDTRISKEAEMEAESVGGGGGAAGGGGAGSGTWEVSRPAFALMSPTNHSIPTPVARTPTTAFKFHTTHTSGPRVSRTTTRMTRRVSAMTGQAKMEFIHARKIPPVALLASIPLVMKQYPMNTSINFAGTRSLIHICKSSKLGRAALGRAGVVEEIVILLDAARSDARGTMLQMHLHTLSMLIKDSSPNTLRFLRASPKPGSEVIRAVSGQVLAGAFMRPVCIPLSLLDLARNSAKILSTARQDVLVVARQDAWETRAYDEEDGVGPGKFGVRAVREFAVRPIQLMENRTLAVAKKVEAESDTKATRRAAGYDFTGEEAQLALASVQVFAQEQPIASSVMTKSEAGTRRNKFFSGHGSEYTRDDGKDEEEAVQFPTLFSRSRTVSAHSKAK